MSKNSNIEIITTVDGKKAALFKNKKSAPIIATENLNNIDKWTPEQYQEYYEFLMPFYKKWYNCEEDGGYRPVVKATNLVANIYKNNVRRKCWCSTCLIPGHEGEKGLKHTVFNPLPNTKLGCWRCEYIGDIPEEYTVEIKADEDIQTLKHKVPRDPVASAFDRYITYKSKLLYNIEMFEQTPTIFRGVRTMYWQPCVRFNELKNVATDNSFKQIVSLNPVIDIDVINKHTKTIFDYWNENYPMLCDIADILDNNDQEYKIMSSGNGWYFILKKLSLKNDNTTGISGYEFWNTVTEGTKTWLTENIKCVQNEYHFDIQVGNMNPMKFVKTPFSIHQKLDTVATPITIDMLNDMNKTEFQDFVAPSNIKESFKTCENLLW